MREIKFRGQAKDGRWVCGYYVRTPITDENSGCPPEAGWYFLSDGKERHCIVQDNVCFTVLTETVGQFTGLKDKNGKEIYEGDILKVVNGSINGYYWDDPNRVVKFIAGRFNVPAWAYNEDSSLNMDSTHHIEIIGNIYENSELLNEKL